MATKKQKQILEKAGYRPVMGRPAVGDKLLPAITVDSHIKKGLQQKAKELGISVPNARREAYRLYIGGVDAAIDDDFERATGRKVE